MGAVRLRFYGELNDFLAAEERGGAVVHNFNGSPAVKDVIESIGVPHTEVDLILVDGRPVAFAHQVSDGERISVYPAFTSLDIPDNRRLQPEPLARARFVLDIHLGQLAHYLRMLGFDSRYRNDFEDEDLAQLSHAEDRILLTRDRELLKRGKVRRGYYLRAIEPREQVVEVLHRYRLQGELRPFDRCMACNGRLESVSRAKVLDQVPPEARRVHGEFRRCSDCGQVYWEGSHVERMRALIQWIESQL